MCKLINTEWGGWIFLFLRLQSQSERPRCWHFIISPRLHFSALVMWWLQHWVRPPRKPVKALLASAAATSISLLASTFSLWSCGGFSAWSNSLKIQFFIPDCLSSTLNSASILLKSSLNIFAVYCKLPSRSRSSRISFLNSSFVCICVGRLSSARPFGWWIPWAKGNENLGSSTSLWKPSRSVSYSADISLSSNK